MYYNGKKGDGFYNLVTFSVQGKTGAEGCGTA